MWLKDQFNTDLSIICDPFDQGRYIAGVSHTLLLTSRQTQASMPMLG
jgi:hypothetical protein